MITLCSIDNPEYFQGIVYSTTVGDTRGMDKYEKLWYLAPTKALRNGHKYQGKSDQWYKDGYRELLAERWTEVEQWYEGLSSDQDITLLCYCPEGKFCHRRILYSLITHYRPDIEIVLH